jgi:hypothetical protein
MWQTLWDAADWFALTALGVAIGQLVCMWLIETWLERTGGRRAR